MISSEPIRGCREQVEQLVRAMGSAMQAVLRHDLPALELSVREQQQLAATLMTEGRALQELTKLDPRLISSLQHQRSLLSKVLPRSATTVRALLSLADPDAVYSPETLPRR